MRKTRLLATGMLGFWLWLAGLPANHDTAGQWLAGRLSPARAADVSGEVTAGATLTGDNVVGTSLTVNAELYTGSGTLTVNAGATLTNNNILWNWDTSNVYGTLINNGTIVNNDTGVLSPGGGKLGRITGGNLTNNNTIINYSDIGSAGGTLTNNGTIANLGAGNMAFHHGTNRGRITSDSGGSLTLYDTANESGGTITGYGSLRIYTSTNKSGGTITGYGSIVIEASTNDAGAAIDNYGTGVTINLVNSGTVTNYAGGTLDMARSTENNAGGKIVNHGTLTNTQYTAGLKMTNNGILENSGFFQNTYTLGLRAVLDNNGALTNNAGGTVDNRGLITNNAGGTIDNGGTFANAYSFDNLGTVVNRGTFSGLGAVSTVNRGTFTNAGVLTVLDNYQTLTNTGTASYVNNGWVVWQGDGHTHPNVATLDNSGTLVDVTNYATITNRAAGTIAVTAGAVNCGGQLTNYGRLVNNGLFLNMDDQSSGGYAYNPLVTGTLTNNGSITNSAGATFENKGGATLNNNGTLYNYGTFANKENMTNDGHVPGTIANTGAIYNYGTLTNQDGSTLTSSGSLYNYGTFTNAAGSTLTVTGGTVYGPIVNNGTFNISGGSFTLPAAGQRLSITNLSGSAAFSFAGITAGAPDVTVTTSAAGSHTLTVMGSGAATGTAKAVDLPAGSTATFTGGGDVGAYYCTLAKGSTLGLDAEDYYFSSSGLPSAISKAAMGTTVSTTTLWYGEMNEIRKRMGELRMGGQSADDFWARAYASRFTVRPAGAGGYSQRMNGLELGRDNPRSFAGGKKYTGFLLGYGKADNTFDGGSGGTTESGYLGAYASWVRENGAYCDVIGKYNRFNTRFSTASDRGAYENSGFGLSAELGKRFERGDGFFIEPAAELAALWAGRAAYTTANGLSVEAPAATSLQLRLGLTGGRKWQGADGAGRQLYGKVAWVNEYRGDSTTRVDGATFETSVKGHQWVAGLGFVYDSGRSQLYIDAEKSWGTTVSKDWGVNAGMRWKF
ncbi:autotransporter outer membrane beta-barrel domain-containing protein [Anaeroselena agilis]|uniref:Autotransporter outer membrane beta-barrel domain-containing protein n=1 Tax=Anaeroselena agilis TaxID=3063788 RepID=A0ABU3P4Q1_9FIRM|nr:autotransporter outer membrane beta-barrel domain-containing protein [Selenomonadales bacterium 4137-cl]